jgi:hypothetical protein
VILFLQIKSIYIPNVCITVNCGISFPWMLLNLWLKKLSHNDLTGTTEFTWHVFKWTSLEFYFGFRTTFSTTLVNYFRTWNVMLYNVRGYTRTHGPNTHISYLGSYLRIICTYLYESLIALLWTQHYTRGYIFIYLIVWTFLSNLRK